MFFSRVLMVFLQMKWALVKRYRALPFWPIWLRWVDAIFPFFSLLGFRFIFYWESAIIKHCYKLYSIPRQWDLLLAFRAFTEWHNVVKHWFFKTRTVLSMCGLETSPPPPAPVENCQCGDKDNVWLDQRTWVHMPSPHLLAV